MEYAKNILETIGNTPLVKINKLAAEVPGWYWQNTRLLILEIQSKIEWL